MGKQSITANDIPLDRLIPAEPIMEGAGDLTQRLQGLLDGQPKDDATVSRALDGMNDLLDEIAAGMYNMASMLVGEGELAADTGDTKEDEGAGGIELGEELGSTVAQVQAV